MTTTFRQSHAFEAANRLIGKIEASPNMRQRAALYRRPGNLGDIDAMAEVSRAIDNTLDGAPERHRFDSVASGVLEAMRLWSRARQLAGNPVHKHRVSLGGAVAKLPARQRTGATRRLKVIAAAGSRQDLVAALPGLTSILADSRVGLDYALLAAQISNWNIPDARSRYVRQWALDLGRTYKGEVDK